jgi:hypothetical protein
MVSVSVCVHYWLIEEALARQSKGVCDLCGEVRQFDNSMVPRAWSEDYSRPVLLERRGHLDRAEG